jgi:excisionase family DNA binding protein
MDETYISTTEFCKRLNISPSTVYRMIRNNDIAAVKFGRCWKIPTCTITDLSKNLNLNLYL